MPPPTRNDVEFDGRRAWLYAPPGGFGDTPCVVLAHGWSGVREQRLDAYAERFAAAGLGALVFDYRHFGASEGEPRQLLDIGRQLEDWRAAVAYARGLAGIDPDRIALWGTSFSGGHVVSIAADDHRVAAVVAQCPFMDGLRNLPRLGAALSARMTVAGLRDQAGALLGRAPHVIPSVGPPGSLAVMTSPDAEPGFRAIDPEDSTWRNGVAARVALRIATYRPVRRAHDVTCPLLVVACEQDAITPPEYAREAADAAPRGEVVAYACGHFDVYRGEWFERAATEQTAFLTRHLLPA